MEQGAPFISSTEVNEKQSLKPFLLVWIFAFPPSSNLYAR